MQGQRCPFLVIWQQGPLLFQDLCFPAPPATSSLQPFDDPIFPNLPLKPITNLATSARQTWWLDRCYMILKEGQTDICFVYQDKVKEFHGFLKHRITNLCYIWQSLQLSCTVALGTDNMEAFCHIQWATGTQYHDALWSIAPINWLQMQWEPHHRHAPLQCCHFASRGSFHLALGTDNMRVFCCVQWAAEKQKYDAFVKAVH